MKSNFQSHQFQIKICRELMTVFNTFDQGFSQSRGLTLFELSKSQFHRYLHLKSQLRQNQQMLNDTPECGNTTTDAKRNSNPIEAEAILKELRENIDEAMLCLHSEIRGSHGWKATTKLREMKDYLSGLFN